MAAECTETTSLLNPNPNPNPNSTFTQSWWQEPTQANSMCSNFPWQDYSRQNNSSSAQSGGEDNASVSNQWVLAAGSNQLRLVEEAEPLPGEFICEDLSGHQSHPWGHILSSGGSTRGVMDYKSQPHEIGDTMLFNLSSSSSSNTNFIFDIMPSSDDYLNTMGTTALDHQDYYIDSFINNQGQRPAEAEMLENRRLPPLSFSDEQLHGGGHVSYNNMGKTLSDFSSCIGTGNRKRGTAGLHTSRTRESTCNMIPGSNSEKFHGIHVSNDFKKKKLDEHTEKMILKRPKDDNSSPKEEKQTQQVPKVKLADKITALQQIVSPFGKTDTASVLWEALGHIKFLQEQIQLLTNAYAKSNTIRKDVPWTGFNVNTGRKDGCDARDDSVDLRIRGLCLVPKSYTSLIFREKNSNTSDYLIPMYRGSLYG